MCILTDLNRDIIVDMLPKLRKETLVAHFQKLGQSFCDQIADVACDYWDDYISVSKICFLNANITLERFHIKKLLNESVDKFRKELKKSDNENPSYKKLKWILHKQYQTLSDPLLDDLELSHKEPVELEKINWTREEFYHILVYN